ncbi:MAG: hypothetical protein ACRERU_07600 [Methylococcales bacterium]
MPGKLGCLIIAVLFATLEGSAESRFPVLTVRIVDQAGLLSQAYNADLGAMLAEHARRVRRCGDTGPARGRLSERDSTLRGPARNSFSSAQR